MIHLYSDSRCPFSHRVRIILHIKDMDFKIIDITINSRQDLMTLNPYNQTPVLVDDIDKNNKKKDLILIDTGIICEYIDERFPHPQLMPIEPAEKARLRMLMHHLDKELFSYLRAVEGMNPKDTKLKKDLDKTKKHIVAGLDGIAQVFVANKKANYIFGNSFSLLDAAVLPLLWRLNHYEIEAKPSWSGMMKYADRLFAKPEFIASLTPAERGMRK
ncbi:MAG: stringent starvation protein [Pseudomonadota bacterium]|nr:stringent starvation protein [Pseudomonadota bacterium]